MYDTMTVKQLIEELQKQPQDAPIVTEGCDCDGDCQSVELQNIDSNGAVLVYLRRHKDEYYTKTVWD